MPNHRTPLLATAVVLMLSAGNAVAESPPASPITKLDARQWSADVLKRRVLGQLQDVLIPIPYPSRHRPPTRPLTDLWFWTVPQSTGVRGLCSSSEVTVYFRPDPGSPQTASAPTHATDLTATRRFRMIAPPRSAQPDYVDRTELNDADEACAVLDPHKDRFFGAPDQTTASSALWFVDRLQKGAETKGLQIDCQASLAGGPVDCPKLLAGLTPSDIFEVDTCQVPEGTPSATTCEDINIDFNFTLHVYANAGGEPFKVKVEDLIFIADERAD